MAKKAKKAKAKKATKTKVAKTKKAKAKKTTRKATKKATRKAAPKARRAKAMPKGAVGRRLTRGRRPQIQATPSDRDGFFIVCELNPATGNFDLNCREVSADELKALGASTAQPAARRGLTRAGRPQISATPSDRDGFFVVCDFNPETRNFDRNCREVSADELRALG
jgi:hypothetical protein